MMCSSLKIWIQRRWTRSIARSNTSRGESSSTNQHIIPLRSERITRSNALVCRTPTNKQLISLMQNLLVQSYWFVHSWHWSVDVLVLISVSLCLPPGFASIQLNRRDRKWLWTGPTSAWKRCRRMQRSNTALTHTNTHNTHTPGWC